MKTALLRPNDVLKPAFGCLLSSALLFTAALSGAVESPDSADQQRMLDKVRASAEQYLENLPNFVCSRVTEQFQAGKKPEHWKQRDTVTDRLIFNQGRENLFLEAVNGKPVPPNRYIDRPLETSGEFGELVSTVLDPKSAAQITWSGWEDLRGHKLAVFEYVIDSQHSMLNLGVTGVVAVLPYRGLLYADAETGELWRITSTPFNFPRSAETRSIMTTIDYGSVTISNKRFILPVSASILLDTGSKNILNKVSFAEYRKFETDSKITFVSGSN